jgi:hypothetical protein
MLDLQDAIGGALDVFCDLMAMSGSKEQSTQDEHIEGTLEEFSAVWRFLGRHGGSHSTLMRVDALPLRK